jgi:hypothetical protein
VFVALLLPLFCVVEPDWEGWFCCGCVLPEILAGLLVGAPELAALAGAPQAESASATTSAATAINPRPRWRDRVNQYIVISLKHWSIQEVIRFTLPILPGKPQGYLKSASTFAQIFFAKKASYALDTLFDSIARHTQEGQDFVARAKEASFRQAVRERDDPFGDYGSGPRGRRAMTDMGEEKRYEHWFRRHCFSIDVSLCCC